jgi:hypothetical protein
MTSSRFFESLSIPLRKEQQVGVRTNAIRINVIGTKVLIMFLHNKRPILKKERKKTFGQKI